MTTSHRPATGDPIRTNDTAGRLDPALRVHGVVSDDSSHAVFALVATATGVHAPPGMLRLPGLHPDVPYRVTALDPVDPGTRAPEWVPAGTVLTGRALSVVGVQAPALPPEHLVLLELTSARRDV